MFPRTYRLARTYAPSADFAERMARICPDVPQLCKEIGIAASTYTRMVRLGTASRQTAERAAQFYALVYGIDRRVAFALLFAPNPAKLMQVAGQQRGWPGGAASARRQASPECGAQSLP